jgi:hypothetical protein
MVLLPYLSAIRFTGPDAADFLHNQLSADVAGLANGKSTFACYCEPKGRVLSLMLVCRMAEDFYVIASETLVQTLIKRLRMYVLRSQVVIEALEEYSVSGLKMGEAPEPATRDMITLPLPAGDKWFTVTTGMTPPVFNSDLADAWKAEELEAGICWLASGSSGQFLPQMLGFDTLGAVNFRKGCYPGQEIVARTHYLGKVKRHPRILKSAGAGCPGTLEKVRITGADHQAYEAVVVDCVGGEKSGNVIFAVTRMDPELKATGLEYDGRSIALL